MLEALGLFVGRHQDSNSESGFFKRINDWLLFQCGGAWDNPAPIRFLLNNPSLRAKTTYYIAHSLIECPRIISFLGPAKYLRYRSIYKLNKPWGWKDPRTTFTLPIWLDLFPGAKAIYMHRRGEEVAHSLRRRGRTMNGRQRLYEKLTALQWIRPKTGPFIGSPRCDALEEGLALWQEYVTQAATVLPPLGDRVLRLNFEDILSEPLQSAVSLADFCGLQVPEERLVGVARMIKTPHAMSLQQAELAPATAEISQSTPECSDL
jgi:hypothetical protein